MTDNDNVRVAGRTVTEGIKLQVYLTRSGLEDLLTGARAELVWRHPQDAETGDWATVEGVYEVELHLSPRDEFQADDEL